MQLLLLLTVGWSVRSLKLLAGEYLIPARLRCTVSFMKLPDDDAKARATNDFVSYMKWLKGQNPSYSPKSFRDDEPELEISQLEPSENSLSQTREDSIPLAPQLELMDYFSYQGDLCKDRPAIDPKLGRLRHWIAFERWRGNTKFVRDDLAHEQELETLLKRDATQAEMMMSAAVVVGSGRRFVAKVNQEWVARKAVELRLNGLSDSDRLRSDAVFGPFFQAAEVVGRDRTWLLLGGGDLPPQAKWRRDPTLQPFIKLLEAILFRVPGLALPKETLVIDMLQLMASTYSTDFVDEALVALNAFQEDLKQAR